MPSINAVLNILAGIGIIIFLVALTAVLQEGPGAAYGDMTPYEQCQIWNKQAEWPRHGGCPGDLQGGWWR